MTPQALKNPYISLRRANGAPSYGGDQGASEDKAMRRCGCGVVGGTDLLLYLQQWRPGFDVPFLREIGYSGLPMGEYQRLADELRRKYFFIVYPFGKDGITLAMGLNRIFRQNRIPLRARWNMRQTSLWAHMERMLADDLPVILSIGPNFPKLWKNHRVNLYTQDQTGILHVAAAANSHFLTVTGMDEQRLYVSSWGGKYVILREEYCEYVKKHSCWLFSNIVALRAKAR